MEMTLLDVKNHLIATDAEFSRLAREHSEHEQQLAALADRPFLTAEQQLQEITLKKEKLSLKDQMERMIQRYKKESVFT